jgi:hypothetical protein
MGPALVAIQLSIQWVQKILSTELKQPGNEAGHSFQVPRLSMRGAITLFQQTSAWSGVNFIAGQRETHRDMTAETRYSGTKGGGRSYAMAR